MTEDLEIDDPSNVNDHLEIQGVANLYEDWFLEYASYVILERAIPAIEDGLKPVQRRILHAMKEMDDGRFNKVANIIGSTMQYHPHGDAAIRDAIVNVGQKELLIECQGNWGDIRTGDSAAAPRYIEARLSKFALDVAFNPKTTNWQLSYDGRKNEPITLPLKFPLLLAQGVEGIAVGLSTKILPHNFIEICEAAIDYLKGKDFDLYPDFPNGGTVDIGTYKDGRRGGKVKIRAVIEELDKKTLLIKQIPYGITTTTLIESIIKANEQGKIKIKKVTDNTAKDLEIEIQLPAGVSTDITIDALYAFTSCELSVSPNACVIIDKKPHFLSVSEILKHSVRDTKNLLKQELEIKLTELNEDWHFSSLEKIFIEKRIYRDIEECETFEAVIEAIDLGLTPYKPMFFREITREDILRLTEIKIKRISKYDSFKADEHLRNIEIEIEETKNHLDNLNDYTIRHYQNILKKYGKGKERKTEIKQFENIQATTVAIANQKLYMNAKEGFIGYGSALKKEEFICDCSDMDDIITFRADGKYSVIRISEKSFVGKDIIHAAVWKKNDDRLIYNLIYTDLKTGVTRAKRFAVTGITRDKVYDATNGSPKIKLWYFTANPNAESELVTITLSLSARARIKVFDYDFANLEIKGRLSQGNTVTKHPIKQVKLKLKGKSTLGGLKLWFDNKFGRLNSDERGNYLGTFLTGDTVTVFYNDGTYEMTSFELTNRYEPEKIALILKTKSTQVFTVVYKHGAQKTVYIKRFQLETNTLDKKFYFLPEDTASQLLLITGYDNFEIELSQKGKSEPFVIQPLEIAEIRNYKAIGTKLSIQDAIAYKVINQEVIEEKESEILDEEDVDTNLEEDDSSTPTLF